MQGQICTLQAFGEALLAGPWANLEALALALLWTLSSDKESRSTKSATMCKPVRVYEHERL